MEPNLYLWLIPALPLFGALINGLSGSRASKRRASAVAFSSIALSFLVAVRAVVMSRAGSHLETHFAWISAQEVQVNIDFYLDLLSAIMTLAITGVGLMIHIYAAGSTSPESGYHGFFVYWNLLVFFMLLLVLSGNYALLFAGWAGVSLCFYLLMTVSYRESDAAAGSSAFLVSRIADLGLLLVLLLIYRTFDSLSFADVLPRAAQFVPEAAFGVLTWIGLLMLAGVSGTLAAVYRELPGPTRRRPLILTAVMLAPCVYVIARSRVFYENAPLALLTSAVIVSSVVVYAVVRYSGALSRAVAWCCTEVLWKGVDVLAIDGGVIDIAKRVRRFGDTARRMQSGNIRSYAGWVTLGALLVIGFMVAVSG